MSALPGLCACGQRLPIGGWPHATCPRCIMEAVPEMPRQPDPRESIQVLRAALELPLLFHAGGPWDDTKRLRWRQITGTNEATTRVMCDAIRAVLQDVAALPGRETGG